MGKVLTLGLLGFGNVGKGLYELIYKNGEKIRESSGIKLEISKALVRNIKKHTEYNIKLTTDIEEIIEDKNIQIVVELTGQIEKGYEFIKKAIQKGKHVVTANKAVLSRYGVEIFRLVKKNGVKLGFEASVGGGIPIIDALTDGLIANRIYEICGILNGTTNFILTKMQEEKLDLKEALQVAIEKGFAEPDPSYDLSGLDARDKISILSSIAFGKIFSINKIPVYGIDKISYEDIEFALRTGYRIKLLSFAKLSEKGYEIWVHPCLIPQRHILANIKDEFNAIFIKGDAIGDMVFIGKGAGPKATASAVLSDIIEITRKKEANLPDIKSKPGKILRGGNFKFYLRFPIEDKPGIIGKITTILGKMGISISYMLATLDRIEKGKGHVKIMVHKCPENKIKKAIEKIKKEKFMKGEPIYMKVADFLRD